MGESQGTVVELVIDQGPLEVIPAPLTLAMVRTNRYSGLFQPRTIEDLARPLGPERQGRQRAGQGQAARHQPDHRTIIQNFQPYQ